MKKCYKCHKTKKNKEFNKNKATKDGLQTYCRTCQKKENAKRFLKEKAKQTIPPVFSFEKYCPKCDTVKYKKDFNKKAKAKDGLQHCCKKCQYKAQQNYMKTYNKKYYKKHYKKEHEIEHKIPVKIIEDKTHIGSAAYTASYGQKNINEQKCINNAYNKACETYAKKIFYDEQKSMSLWERIKFVFKG